MNIIVWVYLVLEANNKVLVDLEAGGGEKALCVHNFS